MADGFRRISFVGGPGAGKSTMASHVYTTLKKRKLHCELVREWVKTLAHKKVKLLEFHQLLIMGEQVMLEHELLEHDKDIILISDGPVILSWVYAKVYGKTWWPALYDIWKEYQIYSGPELLINLERGDRKYNPSGRYQTEDQARELDNLIIEEIKKEGIRFETFASDDEASVDAYVLENIGDYGKIT